MNDFMPVVVAEYLAGNLSKEGMVFDEQELHGEDRMGFLKSYQLRCAEAMGGIPNVERFRGRAGVRVRCPENFLPPAQGLP